MIDDEIARLLKHSVIERGAAPGACAAVGLRVAGRFRFAVGAAGVQSPLRSDPVEVSTSYDLASLTKPVVACAMARLVERGVLSWDWPLARVLPLAAGSPSAELPLLWFLSHRAGLVAHVPLYQLPEVSGSARDARGSSLWHAANARRDECRGQPGAEGFPPVYSDLGYILLGAVMEAVTQRPLDEVVRREVTAPLGLALGSARQWGAARTRTRWLTRVAPTESAPERGGEVHGYVHDENAWLLAGDACAGHAGLFGPALEVARFGAAVLDALCGRREHWLQPTMCEVLVRPRAGGSLRAGFDGKAEVGSSAGNRFDQRAFGHLGFTGTSLWCDPRTQTVVVFLTNRVCPSRQNIRLRALRPAIHEALFDIAARLRAGRVVVRKEHPSGAGLLGLD